MLWGEDRIYYDILFKLITAQVIKYFNIKQKTVKFCILVFNSSVTEYNSNAGIRELLTSFINNVENHTLGGRGRVGPTKIRLIIFLHWRWNLP